MVENLRLASEEQQKKLSVPYSLSLTPVQNKYHEAAQVWDNNCGGHIV